MCSVHLLGLEITIARHMRSACVCLSVRAPAWGPCSGQHDGVAFEPLCLANPLDDFSRNLRIRSAVHPTPHVAWEGRRRRRDGELSCSLDPSHSVGELPARLMLIKREALSPPTSGNILTPFLLSPGLFAFHPSCSTVNRSVGSSRQWFASVSTLRLSPSWRECSSPRLPRLPPR